MAKVLIVDDVYSVRLKTELVLRHAGRYRVTAASSGREAIEAALAEMPDIIVLDIAMSEMDGFATLQELRDHGVTCPVVAYTVCEEQVPGSFVSQGFAAYVSKSENLNELLTTLRLLLVSKADESEPVQREPVRKGSSVPVSRLPRILSPSPSLPQPRQIPFSLLS
jgi:two-component system OmpR family response regulator